MEAAYHRDFSVSMIILRRGMTAKIMLRSLKKNMVQADSQMH